jgi:hypothetical protein
VQLTAAALHFHAQRFPTRACLLWCCFPAPHVCSYIRFMAWLNPLCTLFAHSVAQEVLGRAISLTQWEQNPIRFPADPSKMTPHMYFWVQHLATVMAGPGADDDQVCARGLPPPWQTSVHQLPCLPQPQCMLLRGNLAYPLETSVQMPLR